MFSIKQKAAETAKRAGFVSAGVLLLATGLGFLTLAAWFQLNTEFSPVISALILAVVYSAVGLLFVALGKNNSMHVDPEPQTEETHQRSQPPSDAPPLVQAFLYGLQAGSRGSGSDR